MNRILYNLFISFILFGLLSCKKNEDNSLDNNQPSSSSTNGTTSNSRAPVLVSNFKTSKIKDVYNGNFSDTTMWVSDFFPTRLDSVYPSPIDSNAYIVMEGTPWQNAYVDLLKISSNNADINYGSVFPITSSSIGDVYFNILIYDSIADLRYKYAQLTLGFNDYKGNAISSISITTGWTGWKSVSFKLSEMNQVNSLYNNTNWTDKVSSIYFVLLSKDTSANAKSQKVRLVFDHPVFSFYKPYKY